jgi:dUTP pyrophosphatase
MSESDVLVRVLRLREGARLPVRMTAGASGFDLTACDPVVIEPRCFAVVPTGIAVAIPIGYEAQVRPRSGLAARHGIGVLNAPGTIDADFRGEVRVVLFNFSEGRVEVAAGDRIAQLVVQAVPEVRYVFADELPASLRGEGGFGHTGLA